MATEIKLQNGNTIKFEAAKVIKIPLDGSSFSDVSSVNFKGISKVILDSEGEEVQSSQVVNGASATITKDEIVEVLSPDEIEQLEALFAKLADSSEGFKKAKADEIANLESMGVSIIEESE